MKRAIGLIFAVIAVIVAFLSMRGTLPFMPIYGSSMEPTLHSGSLMMITPVNNPQNIKVGDIIVYTVPDMVRQYYNYPQIVAHRVIKITTTPSLSFRTQGDNTGEDPFTIMPNNVRGTIGKQIPYLGLPILFFQSKQGTIFAIIALALLALFLYGRDIGRGGSWIQKGIFSPVINEEKRANRMLSKKMEVTEKKMDSTEQALLQFSAAVSEYAKHLASHTSAIQGLAEASHELKRGAAEQNRVLSAIMENMANATPCTPAPSAKPQAAATPPKPAAKKQQYKTIELRKPAEKLKSAEPNYHKALKKGLIDYTHEHAAISKDSIQKHA